MEGRVQRHDNSSDLIVLLAENRELMLQKFEARISETTDALQDLRSHVDEKFAELIGLTGTCASLSSKIHDKLENGGSRAALGKRSIEQQQSTPNVPCIDEIITRKSIIWALSLNLCRRLADDLDSAFKARVDVFGENARQSTLSRFLFAIQGSEKKSLHNSVLGKECSAMIRSVILRIFWRARRDPKFITEPPSNSESNGEDTPDWLSNETLRAARYIMRDPCFGPKNSDGTTIEGASTATVKWVEQKLPESQLRQDMVKEKGYLAESIAMHVQDFESYKPKAGAQKRLRTSESNRSHLQVSEDIFSRAVGAARAAILQALSVGRNSARESVFKFFAFVLEGMQESSVERGDFKIDVPEMSSRESDVHRGKERLALSVGDAELWDTTMGLPQRDQIDKINTKKLDDLESLFPFLTCSISYKVRCNMNAPPPNSSSIASDRPQAQSADSGDREVRNVEWVVSEEVSLHKTALNFLYEGLRADSTHVVLRSCKESLKAVHALALAFRALILRTLGKRLSTIESHVLGEVYLNEMSWEQSRTLMTSGSNDRDNGQGRRVFLFVSDRSLTRERLFKRITVSRKEYEEYMARQRRQERGVSEADLSGTEEQNLSYDEDVNDIDNDLALCL